MPDPHDILFRSLADPTRRAIFERLCREGEQTVGALTAQAGVSQPAVSKHLGVLKQAGLVRDRHEGRQTHYSAQLGALAPLTDWTSQMAGFWQSRFDHLEDLLKRMDQGANPRQKRSPSLPEGRPRSRRRAARRKEKEETLPLS
jgi:DNA-binding transcriptional ArsR family regulator